MCSKLQDELQQLTTFRSKEEEVYLSLIRTADLLQRRLNDVFKEFDATHTQYNVLRILRGAGSTGLLTGEIAERLLTHDPDVTRLVDRMEKRGWIERQRDAEDRRCVRVVITQQGSTLVGALDEPTASYLQRQFSHLPSATLNTLIDVLDDLRHASEVVVD